jgi:hypothetical protein
MAQYEVAPELLERYLPRGLELDEYHGRYFVSLVGFLFARVRVLHLPVPLHTRFEEVNLRLYVRRQMPDGSWRRGVVFLSEIVPKRAVTGVANILYGESYSTAKMRHSWGRVAAEQEVRYEWRHRGKWQELAVRTERKDRPIDAGSFEEFVTDHYWGYTPRRDGGASEYAVEHARWKIYPVRRHRVMCDFRSLYGEPFAELARREPSHVLLAEGAPVKIRWGGRVR